MSSKGQSGSGSSGSQGSQSGSSSKGSSSGGGLWGMLTGPVDTAINTAASILGDRTGSNSEGNK